MYINRFNNGTHSTIESEILADYEYYAPEKRKKISLEAVSTPLITIDSIMLNKKIKLIKIDTEGNELDVLKGATKTLTNNPPEMIIIEDRGGVERHKNKCDQYLDILKSYSYKIKYFGKDNLTEDRNLRHNMSDVLFVHSENALY